MKLSRLFLCASALVLAGLSPALAQGAASSDTKQPTAPSSPTGNPAAESPATPPDAAKSTSTSPDVATILFTGSQWSKAPAGTVLTYSYARKTNVKEFGRALDDKVVLTINKGDSEANRTVPVTMFTGGNRQPAGPFENTEQNPVLLLIMEENVQELSRTFKANPLFFKKAIRVAWRDKPEIKQASFDVAGKSESGTIITVHPFVGNAEADRMLGLDGLTYTVKVSRDVPGYIGEIDIETPPGSKAQFSEILKFADMKQQ